FFVALLSSLRQRLTPWWSFKEANHFADSLGAGFASFGAFNPVVDVFADATGERFETGFRFGCRFQRLGNIRCQVIDLNTIRIQHNFDVCSGVEFVVAPPGWAER